MDEAGERLGIQLCHDYVLRSTVKGYWRSKQSRFCRTTMPSTSRILWSTRSSYCCLRRKGQHPANFFLPNLRHQALPPAFALPCPSFFRIQLAPLSTISNVSKQYWTCGASITTTVLRQGTRNPLYRPFEPDIYLIKDEPLTKARCINEHRGQKTTRPPS